MQPKFLGLLFSVEKNIVCGGPNLVAFCFGWLPCKLCLTQESFRKRDKHLVNRCNMCNRDWESTDHLFLYRDCVRELWELSWMLFGVAWVMHLFDSRLVGSLEGSNGL